MLKILLFSKDKENINLITKILERFNYKIQIITEFDTADLNPENIKLIIIDISSLIIKIDSPYINFFKLITCSGIPGMLILNNNQAGMIQDLQNLIIKFDDILFKKQINEELDTRVNFILLKFKIFLPEKYIVFNGLILDKDKYEVTVDGSSVELTFKEYELLKILLENPNKVFSRIKLFSTIWGYDFFGGSRTVDVHMRRLRVKLTPEYSYMLKTIRNVGYMFSPKK